MSILVTGAGGFVGRQVVEALLASGPRCRRVVALDVRKTAYKGTVLNIQYDLLNESNDELEYLLESQGIDCVVHLAAVVDVRNSMREELFRVNVDATKQLATVCARNRRKPRFIFVSSVAAMMGDNVSPYSAAKRKSEEVVAAAFPSAHDVQQRLMTLRPHIVYGHNDPLGTDLLRRLPAFLPIPMFSSVDMEVVAIGATELGHLIARIAISSSHSISRPLVVGYRTSFRRLIIDKLLATRTRPIRLLVVPNFLVLLMALMVEFIDFLFFNSKSTHLIFRLMNRNIIRYMKQEERVSLERCSFDMRVLQGIVKGDEDDNQNEDNNDDEEAEEVAVKEMMKKKFRLNEHKVANSRIIKAATFEAMSIAQLARFHARMATGGVGLTIVSYGSVTTDGASFPSTQLNLSKEGVEEELRVISDAVHRIRGALVGIQLTHAGAFADTNRPLSGSKRLFNPLTYKFSYQMSLEEREMVADAFAAAVERVARSNFDAIELHLGHGYLLSQLLDCETEMYDDYVCSIVERAAAVARSHRMAVLVKLNRQRTMERTAQLARRLRNESSVDYIALTSGHVMNDGLAMLRGDVPLSRMVRAQPSLLRRLALRLFGPYLIPKHEYREAFHREDLLLLSYMSRIPLSRLIAVGGVQETKTLRELLVNDGVAAVEMGRALLRDPDFVIKNANRRQCDRCNRCIVAPTMSNEPLHCVTSKEEGILPEW